MIRIQSTGNKVKLEVETNINATYPFYWDCGSEQYAILLRDHLREKLRYTLEEMRREAYEQGWNDHKKRKPKATWFKSFWN